MQRSESHSAARSWMLLVTGLTCSGDNFLNDMHYHLPHSHLDVHISSHTR